MTDLSESDLNEFNKMMEEELEKAHPSYRDSEPASTAVTSDGRIVPVSDRDLVKVQKFAEEFDEELQGKDNRKMMFVMDIAIHEGETPNQLRRTIDEKGIEATYQLRMAIYLAAKDLGVTYREAGKIISDQMFGPEKGTRLN